MQFYQAISHVTVELRLTFVRNYIMLQRHFCSLKSHKLQVFHFLESDGAYSDKNFLSFRRNFRQHSLPKPFK